MERTSIHALVESALKQMKVDGKAKNTIRSYRYTAFKAIISYFEQMGESEYSDALIDECILTTQSNYESGIIPKYMRKMIRRGGELLKFYHANHTLEKSQSREVEALRSFTELALHQMEADGKAKNTILGYRHTAFRAIIHYFEQTGKTEYSDEFY